MSLAPVMSGMWLNPPPSYQACRYLHNSWPGHLMSSLRAPVSPKSLKLNLYFAPHFIQFHCHICMFNVCMTKLWKQQPNKMIPQGLFSSGLGFTSFRLSSLILNWSREHSTVVLLIGLEKKMSWLICMMTLSSCVCSYDRNKRVFIGLSGVQGEKEKEKVIQRWVGISAFVLRVSSKSSVLCCPVCTAHCCGGCCLSKHDHWASKEIQELGAVPH